MTRNKKRHHSLLERREASVVRKPRLQAIWKRPLSKRLASRKHPVTGEPTKYLWGRIGLDMGGDLVTRLYENGEPILKENFPQDSRLFPYAIEAVRFLVLLFEAEYLVIVKNDDDKGVVAREARETLHNVQLHDGSKRINFFKETGFLDDRKHWLVTKHRTQKGGFCKRHLLNFFVDDKAEVGRYLPRNTVFLWFGTEAKEREEHREALLARARRGRLKFQQVTDWKRAVAEILRHYPNWEECLQGRPQAEQEEMEMLHNLLMAA